MNWNFNPEQYDPNKGGGTFELIPEGDYRCRIEMASESKVKSQGKNFGKDMIVLDFAISGYKTTLKNYIVLDPDNAERTNQNLGRMFDSFGIPVGCMNLVEWIGCVGGVHIVHEEYTKRNGQPGVSAKIGWILKPEEIDVLPPWGETATPGESASAAPAANSGSLTAEQLMAMGWTAKEASVADSLPFDM